MTYLIYISPAKIKAVKSQIYIINRANIIIRGDTVNSFLVKTGDKLTLYTLIPILV
jgi:hypothetical protein